MIFLQMRKELILNC